ncbi:MAG: ribonuclease HII [bacterium]|nr:ribonuclease HII [bacterium]
MSRRNHDNLVARRAQLLAYETTLRARGYTRIAGVDEAGRGPLAGPVVAAAAFCRVDLAADDGRYAWTARIFDSKHLSPIEREELYALICADESPFIVAVGSVDHTMIDALNILRATHHAMRIAVGSLILPPDYLLVDGTLIPGLTIPQEKVIHGDRTCLCIAAASIVAKVTRDRIMDTYARQYPQYGFERHKGYGTPEHLAALRREGRCPIHRRTFHIAGLDPEAALPRCRRHPRRAPRG